MSTLLLQEKEVVFCSYAALVFVPSVLFLLIGRLSFTLGKWLLAGGSLDEVALRRSNLESCFIFSRNCSIESLSSSFRRAYS